MSETRAASGLPDPASEAAILWLDDETATDPRHTGGKGANLARLIHLGVPVPRGFVVTTDSYRATIATNGLAEAEPEALRVRLPRSEIPSEIAEAVIGAYKGLGEGAVAVRSSATAEDLADASFAGQHDSRGRREGEEGHTRGRLSREVGWGADPFEVAVATGDEMPRPSATRAP